MRSKPLLVTQHRMHHKRFNAGVHSATIATAVGVANWHIRKWMHMICQYTFNENQQNILYLGNLCDNISLYCCKCNVFQLLTRNGRNKVKVVRFVQLALKILETNTNIFLKSHYFHVNPIIYALPPPPPSPSISTSFSSKYLGIFERHDVGIFLHATQHHSQWPWCRDFPACCRPMFWVAGRRSSCVTLNYSLPM